MIGMGLSLIAAGAFFVWYLWAFYQKAGRMDDWVETPCTIEKSEIDDSGLTQHYATKYSLVTEYRYAFRGESYLGNRYQRIQPFSSSRKKMESKRDRFPVGSEAICWVNPDDPAQAVLKKDTKAAIYSIWFPGLFVLGGVGIILAALRRSDP